MILTAIERTKRGRYALFVEGEFVFSVSDEQVVKEHLKAGNTISPSDLDRLKEDAERFFSKQKALQLLSARSYTKQGLIRKLSEKADADIAKEIADRMEELGLINDEDYAKRRANDLYKIKKYGNRRVVQDLIQKGISKTLAEEIADLQEPEDQEDSLVELVTKKYGSILDQAEDKQTFFKCRNRVQNALLRKGYGYDEIARAIRIYLEETESQFQ